jgi:hypothetical protein
MTTTDLPENSKYFSAQSIRQSVAKKFRQSTRISFLDYSKQNSYQTCLNFIVAASARKVISRLVNICYCSIPHYYRRGLYRPYELPFLLNHKQINSLDEVQILETVKPLSTSSF